LREQLTDKAKNAAVAELAALAAELGASVGQLAIAWVGKNPRVTSVILGASGREQLEQNLGALALAPKLTPDVMERIDAIAKPLAS
jgi:aryl-alcohol dehydrogenase-like predicted oxidoreductase